MNLLREFFTEEDGMGTVEILLIIEVLVCIALIFRTAIVDFVTKTVGDIFGTAGGGVTDTLGQSTQSPTP